MRSLNSWPGVALTLFALTLPVESKAQVNQLPESNRRPLYESVITVSGDSAERILISQLKGAMSPKTAARALQVESQILLLLDLQVAASLPVAE